MAGWQIETPTAGSTDWTDFETQMQYARSGLMQLSLNPIIDGTTPPKIAAGSKVGISGGLYYFGSTETVSGSATTTNTNYIMLTTSSSSITASFTSEVPTWSASKNGWYDVTGNKRMIGRLDFDSTTYETIGLLPRGESLWDKNGREVLAMQMQTKSVNKNASIADGATLEISCSSLDFTPTALLSAAIQIGTPDNKPLYVLSYPSGIPLDADGGGLGFSIRDIAFDTDEVKVTIENESGSIYYVEYMTVTVARAP